MRTAMLAPALAAALLLLVLPAPTASAELECGDPWNPCKLGPCAEVYQDGSAFVVDPGTPSCYRTHGFDTADDWLAWTGAMTQWLRDVLDWLECGGHLECPSPGNPPQDPAGIL